MAFRLDSGWFRRRRCASPFGLDALERGVGKKGEIARLKEELERAHVTSAEREAEIKTLKAALKKARTVMAEALQFIDTAKR